MLHTNNQINSSLLGLITATALAALGVPGCVEVGPLEDAPLDDSDPEVAESTAVSALTSPVLIQRGYKPSTGEHFYTTSVFELWGTGFQLEGWNYFGLQGAASGEWVPFYRCYWPAADKHLYTQQANCEGQAWNEGELGFIRRTPGDGATELYRLYLPSTHDHIYTTSLDEAWYVWSLGYGYEGIAGYVHPKS
jgi:hypothetical protein